MSGDTRQAAPALQVTNLTVRFGRHSRPVLHGVSFALAAGGALGVIGRSGSGKTTLALCSAGLLKPALGEVHHEGCRPYRHWSALAKRRPSPVQMVFQDPFLALNPRRTIGAWLELIERRAGGSSQGTKSILEHVRLHDALRERRPAALSGGELQRVCIAAALVAGAKVLVLDEPVSMLDAPARRTIVKILRDLRGRLRASYLVVTHDFSFLAEVCESVIVLDGGSVVEQGPVPAILENPRESVTAALVRYSFSA